VRALGIAPAIALALSASPALAADCDRACLDGVADRYLAALAAKDASSLPLATDVVFSENLVPLTIGRAGLWRTISGRRDFAIRASDPELGNANWMGIVEENGKPVFLALRAHVAKGGRIDEVETLVGRSPLDNAANAPPPRAIFTEVEPAATRRTRDQLTAIVDAHWTGMETGRPVAANYAPYCARFDNGVATTGTEPAPRPGAATKTSGGTAAPVNIGKMGCYDQLASGLFANGHRVDPRRVWGVDVERGLVIGLYTPNVPGDVPRVTIFGRETPVGPMERAPFTITQIELFKIRDGRIAAVEVVFGPSVPFGMRSPFDRSR